MGLRALCVMLAVAMMPTGGWAQEAPGGTVERVEQLSDILMIGSVIEVMRAEGIAYGDEMGDQMFPGRDGAQWQALVATIYDPDTLRKRFDAGFEAALAGSSQIAAIGAFFGSELGQRVLRLEIEARRALLDEEAEAAARLAYAGMVADGGPRIAALEQFVEANDLVESNVMGALNANLAFYRGMAEAGSPADAMPQDELLAEVWAQEPDIRAETVDWLYPYLALAYKQLSDAELQAYVDFSESPAGQAVNAALFAAFDAVFVTVSRDLGRAAVVQMQGQEL